MSSQCRTFTMFTIVHNLMRLFFCVFNIDTLHLLDFAVKSRFAFSKIFVSYSVCFVFYYYNVPRMFTKKWWQKTPILVIYLFCKHQIWLVFCFSVQFLVLLNFESNFENKPHCLLFVHLKKKWEEKKKKIELKLSQSLHNSEICVLC